MYSVSDETRKPIFEGVQGENEAREIQFDVTAWVEELGEGVCTATAKRPTDTIPYPVTVTRSGNVVTWKPNSTDTAIEGIGAFQLEYSINDSIAKTRIWNTKIAPSLDPAGDPPDPYDNWLAEMRSIEANAIQAADDAEDSADAAAASATSVDELLGDFDSIVEYKYGKNRFDINATQEAGYLGANGQLVQSGNWHTVDYCYVEGFENVYCSSVNNGTRSATTLFFLCTYDANKNFIEKVADMPSYPITLNDDVAYIRWSFNGVATAESLVMLEEGNAFTSYEPFSKTLVLITDETLTSEDEPANAKAVGDRLAALDADVSEVKDAVIFYTPVSLTLTGDRLLNASTGAISETSGHDTWRVSDYTEIDPNSKVMVTTDQFWGQGLYAFYDENRTYISGVASAGGATVTYLRNSIIDTPANAKYIVIGFLYQENFEAPFLFKGVKQSASPSKIWSNKKWACVGDSLTAYNGRTSIHYFDYIAGATGIQIYNMGDSGSGYRAESDLGTAFYQRISSVPTDSDVVTIFGSFNDGINNLGTASDTGTDTLGGCINTTIDNLYSVMPTVQLGIISPTPWISANPYNHAEANAYADLLEAICKRRSIPFLNLYYESNLRPWDATFRQLAYSKDEGNGVHPDETGHAIIAPRIQAFLESLLIK